MTIPRCKSHPHADLLQWWLGVDDYFYYCPICEQEAEDTDDRAQMPALQVSAHPVRLRPRHDVLPDVQSYGEVETTRHEGDTTEDPEIAGV